MGKNEAARVKTRNQVGTRGRHRTGLGQVEGKWAVIARIAGAVLRAILIAFLVVMPSLMLPSVAIDTAQIVVLVAIIAAVMTFIEYSSEYPGIVEFRFAAPFNRLRYISLFSTVFLLTIIQKGGADSGALTEVVTAMGTIIGNAIDFPYSPVRLVVLMMPPEADAALINSVRVAAGLAYLVSLVAMFAFVTLVRGFGWPVRNGSFNVWINLPLFDPTAGGDVLHRLKRDASLNIVLGFLLPFLIPAVVKAAADLVDPISMQNPQTLIWTMSAWAFLPASMIMRGVAMGRVADLIEDKRRRAYAEAADAEDLLQTA